ncbi:MAG: hypothetical protein ACJ731_08645 [Vicinamibacterales bacterium]
MISLRLYDRTRMPSSWTDIIRPGQFVVFAKTFDTGAPCDKHGRPFVAVEDGSCLLFDGLAETEAFCREHVDRAPHVRFEIFDSTGRAQAPLLVVVHPSKEARLDGNARGMRLRLQGAIALLVIAAVSFWYDFRHGSGVQIFPTLLGINLVVVAARLLQLNGSYAHAERVRKHRLAEYERRTSEERA